MKPIVLLLIITIYFCNQYKKARTYSAQNLYWGLCLLTWIFVVSIRSRVGIDSMIYEDDFVSSLGLSPIGIMVTCHYEFLWSLLMYIVGYLKLPFVAIQIFHAIVFNVLLFTIIRRVSVNPNYVILLFLFMSFFYFETEILRESLAVAISSFAMIQLYNPNRKKKDWLNYSILCVIAILFHTSACIMLIVPFLKRIVESNNWTSKIVLLVAVISFFIIPFTEHFLNRLFPSYISEKIVMYQNRTISGNLLYLRIVLSFIACVICYYTYRLPSLNGYRNLIRVGVFMYTMFSIGSIFNYVIFHRLSNYFVVLYYVATIEIISYGSLKHRKIAKVCLLMLLVNHMYSFSRPAVEGTTLLYFNKYIPYTTIFEDYTYSDRELFHVW